MTSKPDTEQPVANTPQIEPKYRGVKHFFAAFRYSLDGFKACFKHEAAFRQELFMGVIHFVMLFVLSLTFHERLYLGSLWFLLIICELLNSALEAIVDLVSPDWNPYAKRAKDMGSATVFTMLTLLYGSWFFIVGRLLGWWG